MYKQLFGFLIAITLVSSATAQDLVKTIKGKVVDKDTKQPIFGVNVYILNSNPPQDATTIEDGSFKIEKVNVGRRSLRFTYIGYEDASVNELLVSSGKETFLNIEMQEKINSIKEVEVTGTKDKSRANNEFATISARSFSAEEMLSFNLLPVLLQPAMTTTR